VPRGVVLDELAGVMGEDFTVVGGSLRFPKAKAVLSGAVDDGGQGDFLAVIGFESGFDVAVVVGADGHVLVLD